MTLARALHETVGSPTAADLDSLGAVRCDHCHELDDDDLAIVTYDDLATLCGVCADEPGTCAVCHEALTLQQLDCRGRICEPCAAPGLLAPELPAERAIEPSAARWGW